MVVNTRIRGPFVNVNAGILLGMLQLIVRRSSRPPQWLNVALVGTEACTVTPAPMRLGPHSAHLAFAAQALSGAVPVVQWTVFADRHIFRGWFVLSLW